MKNIKKLVKFLTLTIVLILISIGLFITGKRHEIFIENNFQSGVKYSINGEPYKDIASRKKVKEEVKGLNNVIFIRTDDGKVIEKELSLGISRDINIFIKEIINSSDNWFEEKK